MKKFARNLKHWTSREDGTALVEFAIFLPVFVLSFFVIVEFSRTFFAYQGALSGVRDAVRYAARITNDNVCEDGLSDTLDGEYTNDPIDIGGGVSETDALFQIVWRNIQNERELLPAAVELVSVSSRYVCTVPVGGTLRQASVPMAEVTAVFRISLPLIGLLEINGGEIEGAKLERSITDVSRIYGV